MENQSREKMFVALARSMDFSDYEDFLARIDEKSIQIKEQLKKTGWEIKCRPGCNDCCHVVIYIQSFEMIYIVKGVLERGHSFQKEVIKSCKRLFVKLKTKYPTIYHAVMTTKKVDKGWMDVLGRLVGFKGLCVLNKNGRCVLYKYRPLGCRVHGYPTRKVGTRRSDVCSKSIPGGVFLTCDTFDLPFIMSEEAPRMLSQAPRAFLEGPVFLPVLGQILKKGI